MKVSEKVAFAIKDISEIKIEVYKSAKEEKPLPPIKYQFFFERVACDYEEIAKEYGKYDALVKNNKSAHFVSLQVKAEKEGKDFKANAAISIIDSLVAEERIARNYFEAAMTSTDKLLQALRLHLDIFKSTSGSTF
jgi:hypothetical protein